MHSAVTQTRGICFSAQPCCTATQYRHRRVDEQLSRHYPKVGCLDESLAPAAIVRYWNYPAAGGCAMTVGRKPYLGVAKLKLREPEPIIGMPGMPGMPAVGLGAAPAVWKSMAPAFSGVVIWLAGFQPPGTDNEPTSVARPIPADTGAPPPPKSSGTCKEDGADDNAGMPPPPPRGRRRRDLRKPPPAHTSAS